MYHEVQGAFLHGTRYDMKIIKHTIYKSTWVGENMRSYTYTVVTI